MIEVAMGGSVSQVFRSGSALLAAGHPKLTEQAADAVHNVFDALVANPKVSLQRLEGLLLQIPKNCDVLGVTDGCGYNVLQRCVGLDRVELVRWLLTRHHVDVSRAACSLPLHIACLQGYEECVELLLKHGAKIDAEARMCFPGPHLRNCEESGKYSEGELLAQRQTSKLQSAVYYAIDGDQVHILNLLMQKMEEPWMPFRVRKPLLHIACERGAWKCVQHLVTVRAHELHTLRDEYYPIHQAVLHELKFAELLLAHGADPSVRTCTQQMSLLHVVLLVARKSAEDTLAIIRLLLERGCKDMINAPDSLGNTPLHALVVRYALEEAHYGCERWSKWDVLTLARALLAAGARHSTNAPGNSALAYMLRHVRDWDVCYELLGMLLAAGAEPDTPGRDGSAPIMVCLVPLINKDPLHHFTHTTKVCYLNCIRILLQYGANPNCSYRCNLTPLHVLIFAIGENMALHCDTQKQANFDFIENLLLLLLQHGLDCNVRVLGSQHILQSCADMVRNVRSAADLACVVRLARTLLTHGADPDTPLAALPRAAARPALHYLLSRAVDQERILSNPAIEYGRIAHLLYASMSHEPLWSCLRALHTQFVARVPDRSTERLVALVRDLYRTPRSLQQLARLAIYKALDRRPATRLARLNLPPRLHNYVLSLDS